MDIDDFRCRLHITPIWWHQAPLVKIRLDDAVCWHSPLAQHLELDLSRTLSRGEHVLILEYSGKTNEDTQPNRDQAVTIDSIDFFGISDNKFKLHSIYQPDYPEPWRTQQLDAGLDLATHLIGQDYLAWNGTWRLEFTTPIFTWMHRVQDLGWIYE